MLQVFEAVDFFRAYFRRSIFRHLIHANALIINNNQENNPIKTFVNKIGRTPEHFIWIK